MKKFLFGCAIAVSGLTMPLAANNFCCPPSSCDPCCYGSSFDGFYVGGNLGVYSDVHHVNDYDGFLGASVDNYGGFSSIRTGFEAGVQLGYDWACGSTLFGIVGDWNWLSHTRRRLPVGGADNFVDPRLNWFSTIRLRAGVTVCDALLYVTAGAAAERARTRWNSVDAPARGAFTQNHTHWGWVGGVGAEWLLGCNWSLGAEILLAQFNTRHRTVSALGDTFTLGAGNQLVVGRVLLNYRFGDLCGCF